MRFRKKLRLDHTIISSATEDYIYRWRNCAVICFSFLQMLPREKGQISEPRKVPNSVAIIDFPSRLIFRVIFRIYFPTSILYFSDFDFSNIFEFGNPLGPDYLKIEVGKPLSLYRLLNNRYREWTHYFLGK